MNASKTQWGRLGDYIEQCDERNTVGLYTLDDVRGISTDKIFIPTKANMDGVSLTSYKIVNTGEFAYVADTSRRGDKIALALNSDERPFLISSIYTTFRSKDINELLPEYLYLLLSRSEFDRYARFNSWGSARETFDWEELCRVRIPLPTIEVQQELVDTYNGLKSLAEQNGALIEPLSNACQAFIVDCKNKYPEVPLGKYIEECDERNTDLSVKLSQGISNLKYFQNPKQVAENSRNDKIVRTGQFAYNRATTRNGEKISIAYRDGEDCTVSSAYGVFRIIDEQSINPYFLMMWFKRPEFDRYARWRSEGSAHEFFTFEMMQEVRIPLPPSEIQKSVVNIYSCLEEAKKIASEARKQLKTLCPALVQKAANS
ncbi:MAG: restriction endonuclease subunit S [Paludibacteraceae bacterium]